MSTALYATIGNSHFGRLSRAWLPRSADCFRAFLSAADTNTLAEIDDEYLAVPDLAGACARDNSVNSGLNEIVIDGNLQAHLFQEVYLYVDAAIGLVESHLLAAPECIGDGHLVDSGFKERLLDVV